MLRWITIAHLAPHHSPLREQRLLLFAATNPKDQLNPKNAEFGQEFPNTDNRNITQDVVGELQAKAGQEMKDVTPDQILRWIKPDVMFDMLQGSGALSDELERAASELGLTMDTETPDKARIVDHLLVSSDTSTLIRASQAIARDLEKDEELLRSPEQNLKRIERMGADQNALNESIERITGYADKDGGSGTLEQALDNEYITTKNIVEILKIKGDFTPEQRVNILDVLRDIDRSNRLRSAYGQAPGPVERDPKKRAINRARFSAGLSENLMTLVEYIESKLRTNIRELEPHLDDISIRYDGETLERFGITVDGIGDALVGAATTLSTAKAAIGNRDRKVRIDTQYLLTLSGELEKLERVGKDLSIDTASGLPTMLLEKKYHEEGMEDWARFTAEEVFSIDVEMLRTEAPRVATQLEELQKLFMPFSTGQEPTVQERIGMRQMTSKQQELYKNFLAMVKLNPKALEEPDRASPTPDQIASTVADVRSRMGTLMRGLLAKMDHPICDALHLTAALKERETEIGMDLHMAEEVSMVDIEGNLIKQPETAAFQKKRGECVKSACIKLERLQEYDDWLSKIEQRDENLITRVDNPTEYVRLTHGEEDDFGCYDYKSGLIYLNTKKIESTPSMTEAKVIQHETGHLIIDGLRRCKVFPALLLHLHNRLHHEKAPDGKSFQDLLLMQAPTWGLALENPEHPTKSDIWKLMDELANRYSDWKSESDANVSPELTSLFRLFEQKDTETHEDPLVELTGTAKMNGGHEPDDDEHDNGESQTSDADKKEFVDSMLEKAEKTILDCDAFFEAYPQTLDSANKIYHFTEMKEAVGKMRASFKSGAYVTDATLVTRLKDINKTLEDLYKETVEIEKEQSDLTGAGKTGARTLTRVLFHDVEWMSIYDMMTMFNQMGEDIQRMWKRRGEGVSSRVGKAITGMIPDEVMYLGRLKHEFERRDRESEEAEVGVWEKGWEKIDAHDLQHQYLPKVTNTDQLKAIIKLLAHHGRLDWNDSEGLWKKLEFFSGYHMPRNACLKDTRLRNSWLQKMIADIWRDKDLYENWKTENDGSIKSGTDKFTNYADDLSALGMHGTELKKMLQNWEKVKAGTASKEEEVNPHLYEKILFHAMYNGKSSMEAKFFYLIKGVQSGLLSIDRLRAFSGENFGILNQFPFIDFFSSGQNNTYYEIDKISRKVTEYNDPFEPGNKMTAFLYNTVAFDYNVSKRVGKALKNVQNIDHEDVPMYITHLGFSGIDNMITFQSGSQWRMSPAALQNGYVGYNSFMKYFALKAKFRHPPITQRDILKLATTLGGYAMWDNKITRKSIGAIGTDNRDPNLSWQEIDQQAPVSGGNNKTSVFRDNMNNFTVDLCKALGMDTIDGFKIKDFIGVSRKNDSAEELLRIYGKKDPDTGKLLEKSDDIYVRMKSATSTFVDQLEKKMEGNMPAVVTFLASYAEDKKLIPENGDFTLEKAQQFWNSDDNGNAKPHLAPPSSHH